MQSDYEMMGEEFVFLHRTYFQECKDYLCEVLNKEQIQNQVKCEWGKKTTYAVYVASEDIQRAQRVLNQQLIHLVELGESASDSRNRRMLLMSAIFVAILVILTYIGEHH